MRDEEVQRFADSLWDYMLKKHLKEYLSDSVCYYRATVTTAAANGVIGITRPFDSEIFLPYSFDADSLNVGDECVVLVFGDSSNATVIGDGTLQGGGGPVVQTFAGYEDVASASYIPTAVTLTVEKTGNYNVSWMGYRSSTGGTSGSALYVNGSIRGSENTTFDHSYGQYVFMQNQSFNAGDVLVVWARSRSASYYMGVGNLIIEEV